MIIIYERPRRAVDGLPNTLSKIVEEEPNGGKERGTFPCYRRPNVIFANLGPL